MRADGQAQQSGKTQVAVIVTMTVIRMVKMSADQIVDVVSSSMCPECG